MSLPVPDFSQDHFSLFGLPQGYGMNMLELDSRFREIQARVHPDKFVHLGEVERRLAMQWSTQVNEAYQTLKSPLLRAQYLLQLRGIDPGLDNNTAMPATFLVQQMELRETVEAAREAGDTARLDELREAVREEMLGEYAQLGVELDETGDNRAAANTVRRMMFQEKLLDEIDNALETI